MKPDGLGPKPLVLLALATRALCQPTNAGVTDLDLKFTSSDSFLTKSQISDQGGVVLYIALILYIFASLSILKTKYMYPFLEDICEVYH